MCRGVGSTGIHLGANGGTLSVGICTLLSAIGRYGKRVGRVRRGSVANGYRRVTNRNAAINKDAVCGLRHDGTPHGLLGDVVASFADSVSALIAVNQLGIAGNKGSSTAI